MHQIDQSQKPKLAKSKTSKTQQNQIYESHKISKSVEIGRGRSRRANSEHIKCGSGTRIQSKTEERLFLYFPLGSLVKNHQHPQKGFCVECKWCSVAVAEESLSLSLSLYSLSLSSAFEEKKPDLGSCEGWRDLGRPILYGHQGILQRS